MKTFFDGIFIDSEKLKEEEIEYPIKLEYYKIISIEKSVEEKYGIEIVKTEYRDGNVYVESEKTENVTDSDEEINEILNTFRNYEVTPIGMHDVLNDMFENLQRENELCL